jgi:hypothetical protein
MVAGGIRRSRWVSKIRCASAMKVKIVGLPKGALVRRFVDLPRLFDLLLWDRTFFPKIETLAQSDPFESGFVIPSRCKERNTKKLRDLAVDLSKYLPYSNFRCNDGDLRKDFFEMIDNLKGVALRNCILDMEMRKFRQRIVCSCWYLGDEESDAMWKVYADRLGVALVSTVGRLASSLKGRYSNLITSYDPQEYLIAPVRYVGNSKLSRLPQFYKDHPWMLKRSAFRHEKEVRICHELPESVWARSEPGSSIGVSTQKLVREIILSPFNPAWVNDSLRSAISVILERRRLNIRVRVSEHMRPPTNINAPLGLLEIQNALGTLGLRRKWRESVQRLKKQAERRR